MLYKYSIIVPQKQRNLHQIFILQFNILIFFISSNERFYKIRCVNNIYIEKYLMVEKYTYNEFDLQYFDDEDNDRDINIHYCNSLIDPDEKFERTKEYFLKHKIKTDGEPDSVTWLEQVDAISILVGYNKDTLNYFFEKFQYNVFIENNIIPLFYEEDGRCLFDLLYSTDKNTVKNIKWYDKNFTLKFGENGICNNDKCIREKIMKIMDNIEDYAMQIIDPGNLF